VLRALLVQNDALLKSNEMLRAMTTLLSKLLAQTRITVMPSETPPETVAMVAKANGPIPAVEPDPQNPLPPLLDEPKGPTLADLKVALQACIAAHDQDVARRCIAPYATYSMVPVDKLAEVIAKVEAATRSVVP
jgi:hypothetical protein